MAGGMTLSIAGAAGAAPVRLTVPMLTASARGCAPRGTWQDDDRWLAPIPLAHVGGLSVLTRCLRARPTAVLGDLGAIERDRITLASIVPAQLARLAERDAPAHVRAVLVGGAAA